ncbi:hypothetical protein [Rhizobium deserti]|uniref:hypothetical protein n=1 Tax=Rhizobium deserti TaxID=2547961 RepID=UPI003CCA92E2
MVVETLLRRLLGRPRVTRAADSRSSQGLSVRSGASSSLVGKSAAKRFLLSVIGFPHADNSLIVSSRRPNNHDHPASQKADSEVSGLSVVGVVIFDGQMRPIEHLTSMDEVETLDWRVESRFAGSKTIAINCYYKNKRRAIVSICVILILCKKNAPVRAGALRCPIAMEPIGPIPAPGGRG